MDMEHFISGHTTLSGPEILLNCLRCKKPLISVFGAHRWVHTIADRAHGIVQDDAQVSSPVHGHHFELVGKVERLDNTLGKKIYSNPGGGQRNERNNDLGEVMSHTNDLENQIR